MLTVEIHINWYKYFNFEPSFKLRECRPRDLLRSYIPVITGGFELRISCIRSSYLTHYAVRYLLHMQEVRNSKPSVITGIYDPNKSRAGHHRKMVEN